MGTVTLAARAPWSRAVCGAALRGMRGVPVSSYGYAIASSVFELRDDGERFIGIVPAKKSSFITCTRAGDASWS